MAHARPEGMWHVVWMDELSPGSTGGPETHVTLRVWIHCFWFKRRQRHVQFFKLAIPYKTINFRGNFQCYFLNRFFFFGNRGSALQVALEHMSARPRISYEDPKQTEPKLTWLIQSNIIWPDLTRPELTRLDSTGPDRTWPDLTWLDRERTEKRQKENRVFQTCDLFPFV